MAGTDVSERISAPRDAEMVDPGALDVLWAELAVRWHGECFDVVGDAQPHACRAGDGGLLSSVIFAGRGDASPRKVESRGELTTTTVYGQHCYFSLERQP